MLMYLTLGVLGFYSLFRTLEIFLGPAVRATNGESYGSIILGSIINLVILAALLNATYIVWSLV